MRMHDMVGDGNRVTKVIEGEVTYDKLEALMKTIKTTHRNIEEIERLFLNTV